MLGYDVGRMSDEHTHARTQTRHIGWYWDIRHQQQSGHERRTVVRLVVRVRVAAVSHGVHTQVAVFLRRYIHLRFQHFGANHALMAHLDGDQVPPRNGHDDSVGLKPAWRQSRNIPHHTTPARNVKRRAEPHT